MSLMVEAKMAAPLSTSCLQRCTLLQEAAQCSGVLEPEWLKMWVWYHSGLPGSSMAQPSKELSQKCHAFVPGKFLYF
jgi:hypothetical protein